MNAEGWRQGDYEKPEILENVAPADTQQRCTPHAASTCQRTIFDMRSRRAAIPYPFCAFCVFHSFPHTQQSLVNVPGTIAANAGLKRLGR